MQTVITEMLARKLTGGRRPLVPVEYEQACTALAACLTLDEAKYWSDKASALAAWAKIYHEDRVLTDAKRLKLKAYRRMGELAGELQPGRRVRGNFGSEPGPYKLLLEHGLKQHSAAAARRLARMRPEQFSKLINVPRPPSPSAVSSAVQHRDASVAMWYRAAMVLRTLCRGSSTIELINKLTIDDRTAFRTLAVELIEWLDEFERHIPKTVEAKGGQ